MRLRFRLDERVHPAVRGRADIVFRAERVAIYVDGCFWHGCPDHATSPKSNAEWWQEKLEANRLRDATATARLQAAGWCVLRFWEHEDPNAVARVISSAVAKARRRRGLSTQ